MLLQLIKKPLITESTIKAVQKSNAYTFLVARTAKKNQIAQAIEEIFNVNVTKVRTAAIPAELKKTGKRRLLVQKPIGKKAYVVLKENQSIDLFDIGGKS